MIHAHVLNLMFAHPPITPVVVVPPTSLLNEDGSTLLNEDGSDLLNE